MVVSPRNQPSIAKLLDLEMLVTTGGRERTEKEFKTLLESSEIELSQTIATKENICVIEGVRL
jgi:O-methyltransferase